ncbi:MAG: hypothetical protein Q4A71_07230 [Actinomycetaceae bacterium]|nr:hypothetical protein [Actinomycetaceae bacterium]
MDTEKAPRAALAGVTAENVEKDGISAELLNKYPVLRVVADKFAALKEAKDALQTAQTNADKAAAALKEAKSQQAEAKAKLQEAQQKLAQAKATYEETTRVSALAPQYVNPSAADPANCLVNPFVTVKPTYGVTYTVTVDGVAVQPGDGGKYEYPYGKTVVVNAAAAAGLHFPEGAQTSWIWSAVKSAICKATPEKPEQPKQPG